MEEALDAVRAHMRGLRPPGHHEKVFKDECMFSFSSPESPGGLYINLKTFQGFGDHFVNLDHSRTSSALYLHEKWHKIPLSDEELEQQKAMPEKMALGGDGGFSLGGPPKHRVEKERTLVILPNMLRVPLPCPDLPEIVLQVIEAVLIHASASNQEEVQVWEEERKVSRYAESLPQLEAHRKISPNPKDWRCEETGATENLWLNLSTGFIGSGRRNWDGTGGNGSALRHFQATGSKYPLAVKLGTITPHGADVYSYAPDEDDMVSDPLLATHLAHWGINMMQMEKTEKTMAELQIDLNLSYEFGRITESGSALRPLCGPGYIGLINLGNSCYMNSVLQMLAMVPEVRERYVDLSDRVFQSSLPEPVQDMAVQLCKVYRALARGETGRSQQHPERDTTMAVEGAPAASDDDAVKANAVRPFSFKSLVGKGHAEFSSARQQDALEFFQYLLEQVGRCEHANNERLNLAQLPPTKAAFTFKYEDRVQCLESGHVSYKRRMENTVQLDVPVEAAVNKEEVERFKEREAKRRQLKESNAEAFIGQEAGSLVTLGQGEAEEAPVIPKVPFAACLERLSASEVLEDYSSAALGGKRTQASKMTRFASFPPYLVLALRRYYIGEGWVPKKLDVLVDMPDRIDLSSLRGHGPQPGEALQPEAPVQPQSGGGGSAAAASVVPDESIVAQLVMMGFGENGCRRAALATGNSNAEAAMEWILGHMEDPDFNDPLPAAAVTGGPDAAQGGEADPEQLSMLGGMGFSDLQAKAALKACSGNLERAADWLFSHMDDLDSAVKSVMEAAPAAATGPVGTAGPEAEDGGGLMDGTGMYELVGFVSHMGSNTACGHYVCHLKKDGKWAIFNDEKVAESENPPKDLGYMYLYRRLQI